MSDFECKNGHLMPCGKSKCPECGAPLWTMDGCTARELEARDKDDDGYTVIEAVIVLSCIAWLVVSLYVTAHFVIKYW